MNHIQVLQIHNILKQLSLVVVGVIFAHSFLTVTEIGIFESLTFLGYSLSYFWLSGFQSSILTQYGKLNGRDKKSYIKTIFTLIFGLSTFIFLSLFISYFFIDNRLTNYLDGHVYLVFIFYLWFILPSYFVDVLYIIEKSVKTFFIFSLINFISQIIALGLPIFLGYSLYYALVGFFIFSILKFSWLLIKLSQFKYKLSIDWLQFKRFKKLAILLSINAAIAGFALVFDGWLVDYYFDKDIFANFRYGTKELPLVSAMAAGIAASAILALGSNQINGLELIKKQSKKALHILMPISIVLLFIADDLFNFFFTNNFILASQLFKIYLLIIVSRLTFPQSVIMAKEDSKVLIMVSILEIIINVILSLIFLKYWGIYGIAFATIIAYYFEKIILFGVVIYKYNIKASSYTPIFIYAIYSIVLLCVFYYTF